jgi:hypothetical protein
MFMKKLFRCLLIGFSALLVSLPGHAAMVGTAQMQVGQVEIDLTSITEKRDWINQQLITGGVGKADARLRVAAMTDAQILQLHQRFETEPAGGNVVVAIILILLITELTGVTDIIPAIRPAN